MRNNPIPFIVAPARSALGRWRLLREFVARDVKGPFAGSMAGAAWTLIHPLATIAVYIVVFSQIIRVQVTPEETGTADFAVFFLSGMFPWLMFADGLNRAAGSLLGNANLITKVVFPVELLPACAVLSALLVNGAGMVLLLVYLAVKGYLALSWLGLLLVIPLQLLFTWGLASFLAAVCVFLRDVREFLGIVLMVWFFVTPILYPPSMLPEGIRNLARLNPMAVLIPMYRDLLLKHQIEPASFLYMLVLSLSCYCAGAWFLMRARPAFGDVL
jgi:lipopolysaccharide transport system permease protein